MRTYPTAKDRILTLLSDGYPHTTIELARPEVGGIRFGDRIEELRKLGYTIDSSEGVPGTTWRYYKLVARPGWVSYLSERQATRVDASSRGPRRHRMAASGMARAQVGEEEEGPQGRLL